MSARLRSAPKLEAIVSVLRRMEPATYRDIAEAARMMPHRVRGLLWENHPEVFERAGYERPRGAGARPAVPWRLRRT